MNGPFFGPTLVFVILVIAQFPSDRLLSNRASRVLILTEDLLVLTVITNAMFMLKNISGRPTCSKAVALAS